MYIKVHRQGNQWFREDNGTLVGNEIEDTNSIYRNQHHIINTDDNRYFIVVQGYVNDLNQFIPLCKATCIPSDCKLHNTDTCFWFHEKDTTTGSYIFSD